MITTCNTQRRIIKAMANGAKLVFHIQLHGTWNDGWTNITKVTLERGKSVLTLSASYREDEYHFVPFHEDGICWLRHGAHSKPESGADIAHSVTRNSQIRDAYAGHRNDYDARWRHVYEHVNQPIPRWIAEQWGPEQWEGQS